MGDDKDPVFDKKYIEENILNFNKDKKGDIDSYETYIDKKGVKRVKVNKTKDTFIQIEYVIRAIKKLKEEDKQLTIPNIFYKVRPKKMRYRDVTRLYTTLEFDFGVKWSEPDEEGRISKVLKEDAYEPLLGILDTYDNNQDYEHFKKSLKIYIGNAIARVERDQGITSIANPYTGFDSSKNL